MFGHDWIPRGTKLGEKGHDLVNALVEKNSLGFRALSKGPTQDCLNRRISLRDPIQQTLSFTG